VLPSPTKLKARRQHSTCRASKNEHIAQVPKPPMVEGGKWHKNKQFTHRHQHHWGEPETFFLRNHPETKRQAQARDSAKDHLHDP